MKDSAAPEGAYTLLVWATDPRGRTDTVRFAFHVVAKADQTGPVISIVAPNPDTVLPNADSLLAVQANISDASGVDSVTIQGVRVQGVGGIYSSQVHLEATGASTAIHVVAWDKLGNVSDQVVRASRMPVSGILSPRLVRVAPSTQGGNQLSISDSVLTVVFAATSPNGVADTGVRIGGNLAKRTSDSLWSLDVRVLASGFENTIAIDLIDKKGAKVSDWVKVTRTKDATGPVLQRISPVFDTIVDYASSIVAVRVKAQDVSGVDSVRIDGQKSSDLGGGNYLALVSLQPSGKPTTIHVVAWDHMGNQTDSVITATRKAPSNANPPRLSLANPTSRHGTVLDAAIDSILIDWIATSDLGMSDTAVRIGGQRAVRVDDSTWSRKVFVAGTGTEIAFAARAIDAGGQTISDTVWVARSKTLPHPTVKIAFDSTKGDPPLRQGAFATLADSLLLVWSVSGNCEGCIATIDGKSTSIAPASLLVALAQGVSGHVIQILSDGHVVAKDSVSVHRFPRLVLKRLLPVSDTVDNSVASVDVVWTATNAASVKVDGVAQAVDAKSSYTGHLTSLKAGSNTTRIVAIDSLGGTDSSVATIFRIPKVDLSLVADNTAAVLWDSAGYAISSLTTGAGLAWSTDGQTWRSVPASGHVSVDRSGKVYAKATLAGYLQNLLVSDSVTVRHKNVAPSYARLVQDTIKLLEDAKPYRAIWAGSLSRGGVWDSVQSLGFRVSPIGNSAALFSVLPAIDASTGILTFTLKPDANGVGKFRVVLGDDGGRDNFGVDSSKADTFVVAIAAVNDAPTMASISVDVRLMDGAQMLDVVKSSTGGGTDESGQKLTYTFQAANDAAANCFLEAPKIQDLFAGYPRLYFKPDPACGSGSALFRGVVRDDGGTSQGGVDSAVFSLTIGLSDTVVDGSGNTYHYRKFGDLLWLRENIGSTCQGCAAAGAKFDSVARSSACPSDWRLPTSAEWKSLVGWAAEGAGDSVGTYHLRSVTDWDGDDSKGFGLVANLTLANMVGRSITSTPIAFMWTSESGTTRLASIASGISFGSATGDMSNVYYTGGVRCVH